VRPKEDGRRTKMLMFLTLLLVSFAVLTATAVAAVGLAQREESAPSLRPERSVAVETPKFFVVEGPAPETRQPIPLEVLLAQIDRHVRLEQAAARTFLDVPTAGSLHSRTESPLVLN
jgi:hypothetical protein